MNITTKLLLSTVISISVLNAMEEFDIADKYKRPDEIIARLRQIERNLNNSDIQNEFNKIDDELKVVFNQEMEDDELSIVYSDEELAKKFKKLRAINTLKRFRKANKEAQKKSQDQAVCDLANPEFKNDMSDVDCESGEVKLKGLKEKCQNVLRSEVLKKLEKLNEGYFQGMSVIMYADITKKIMNIKNFPKKHPYLTMGSVAATVYAIKSLKR